jgi:hypothetical protein
VSSLAGAWRRNNFGSRPVHHAAPRIPKYPRTALGSGRLPSRQRGRGLSQETCAAAARGLIDGSDAGPESWFCAGSQPAAAHCLPRRERPQGARYRRSALALQGHCLPTRRGRCGHFRSACRRWQDAGDPAARERLAVTRPLFRRDRLHHFLYSNRRRGSFSTFGSITHNCDAAVRFGDRLRGKLTVPALRSIVSRLGGRARPYRERAARGECANNGTRVP